MTLDQLPIHTYARITLIDYSERTLVKRLQALGIRVGKRVYIVRKSLGGNTIQLRIGTTDVVIRKGPAVHIHVEPTVSA